MYHMFITEVIVGGAVMLEGIILRGLFVSL